MRHQRRAVASVLVALSLFLMTVGLFELAPRYEATGPTLLKNGSFENKLEGWTVLGDKNAVSVVSGAAVLKNRNTSQAIYLRQALAALPGHELLLFSAEVATENAKQGAKSGHAAIVHIVGRTAEGEYVWQTQQRIAHLTGDNAWNLYSAVFTIPDNAKDVVIFAQLVRTTGIILVRNLTLVPVRERAAFRMPALALLTAWAIAFAWISFTFLQSLEPTYARGSVAIIALIITTGVLIPDTMRDGILTSMWMGYERLRSMSSIVFPEIDGEEMRLIFSQLGHFTLFFVFAALIHVTQTAGRRPFQVLGLLLFAAVTEALQYFAYRRQPEFDNWLSDAAGILLAFGLLSLIGTLRNTSPSATRTGHESDDKPPSH